MTEEMSGVQQFVASDSFLSSKFSADQFARNPQRCSRVMCEGLRPPELCIGRANRPCRGKNITITFQHNEGRILIPATLTDLGKFDVRRHRKVVEFWSQLYHDPQSWETPAAYRDYFTGMPKDLGLTLTSQGMWQFWHPVAEVLGNQILSKAVASIPNAMVPQSSSRQ